MGRVKVCPVCRREYASGATNCSEDGVPLVGLETGAAMRPEDLVGKIIEGRYKIERIIGKGGMGTVYACRHVVVGKVAAMKVLRVGADSGEAVLQRFVREAQTANLIRSRHIVEVSDFGQLPNGAFFVVMELLEGQDLAGAMRKGLGRKEMVHVFTQVAETLQMAHDKGIIHRDMKPDNVFLVNDSGDPLFVKLLDFGIAKIVHGESNGGLTETGVILGTPYYMSPEQARADMVDHRSDIYSLGVMMYRAFTGKLPFIADSTMGVLTRHITEDPQPPSKLAPMDPATERLILRCMAKRQADRFQSMREVVEALRQIPTGPVTAAQEHTTVYDGPVPGAAASYPGHAGHTGAHAAPGTGAYAQAPVINGYTGQQQNAYAQPSGAYAQANGVYAQPPQQPSGAFAQASGAYPQPGQVAQPNGAYAQAQQVQPHLTGAQAASAAAPTGASGAFAAMSAPSGAYPQANAFGQPSGAYPQAGMTGAQVAQTSGAYPQAGATGAHQAQGFDPRMSATPAGLPAVPGAPMAGGTETTRGLAATGAMAPVRPGTSTGTIVMGAIAMLAIGALAALLLYRGQPSAPDAAKAGQPTATAVATEAPSGASAGASASAAPSASATATTTAAAATASAEPSARPRGPGPGPAPKAAPSATATGATKRTPRDIRSPFD